jgi:hypothetical protein
MSKYELKRPLYYTKESSLVDRLRNDMFYSYQDCKNTFLESVSDSYNGTLDMLVKAKKVNSALVMGTLASITFNILSTHHAATNGYDYNDTKWASYIGESAVNSIVFAATFLYESRKEGKTWAQSGKDLLSLLPVTFTLSLGPYRMSKNLLVDYLTAWGLPIEGAAPIAQIALLAPFALSVDYCLKKLKYFKKNPEVITQSIIAGTEKVTDGATNIGRAVKYRNIKRKRKNLRSKNKN